MRQRLTKRFVDSIEHTATEQWHTDADVPGFCLRVTPSGAKLYVVRYRQAGKPCKLPIGRHGQITVEQARQKARDVFAMLAEGKDPASSTGGGPTVTQLRERYEAEHTNLHKKPSTRTSDALLWNLLLIPSMGTKAVADITRHDVVRMHTGTSRRYLANRALALLSHALNIAELWGWRQEGTNPCRLVKRYKEHPRERVLAPDEVKALLAELENTEAGYLPGRSIVNLVRLLLLTGCRQSEIRTARWEWVNWQAGTLDLPDGKGGARKVELAPPAIELLERMRVTDRGQWIVPGHVRGQHLQSPAKPWREICKRAGLGALRLHDLRHTYGTMASMSGLSLREVADLLGHKSTASSLRYLNSANWRKKDNAEKVANIFARQTCTARSAA